MPGNKLKICMDINECNILKDPRKLYEYKQFFFHNHNYIFFVDVVFRYVLNIIILYI